MRKKVIFVCATGIATSTAVAEKVLEACESEGIKIDYKQSNVASLPSLDGSADLIIATTKVPYDLKTPVVNALPILSGLGEEETIGEIIEILRG